MDEPDALNVAELASVLEDFTRMAIRLPSQQRLSFTTLSVLHTLAGQGPKRLTELTASEQVTQPAITQTVTNLERDGLVERRADPSDRRAVLVHITAAGAAIVKGRRDERVARLTELADRLAPEDRAAIAAALPALARLIHWRGSPVGADQRRAGHGEEAGAAGETAGAVRDNRRPGSADRGVAAGGLRQAHR